MTSKPTTQLRARARNAPDCSPSADSIAKAPTRLEQMEQLLQSPDGATLTDLMGTTGWQQHSVRGALAGALKKRGHAILSDKIDGVRRYRIAVQA